MGLNRQLANLPDAITTSAGNVGIGTSSPTNPLHIASNTVSQLNVAALSGNTNAQINLEPTGTGVALIGPASAFPLTFRTDATERMRITSGGNVGIGTASPASQSTGTTTGILDVSNSSGGNLVLHRTGSGDTALLSILKGSNGTFIDSTGAASGANNTIYFRTNANNGDATTLNTIASIYTTYAGYGYSTLKVGTDTNANITLTGNTGATGDPAITLNGGAGGNGFTDCAFIQLRASSGGTTRLWAFQIDASNQLATFYSNGVTTSKLGYQSTSGVWTASDERRKTNIEDLEYGLKEVLQLKPKKFHFKLDTEVGNVKQKDMGFIAQEVLPIMPLAVDSGYDGEQQYYSMNYGNIIPTLVKAIQEQQAQIQELSKQNEELSNRLIKLESK